MAIEIDRRASLSVVLRRVPSFTGVPRGGATDLFEDLKEFPAISFAFSNSLVTRNNNNNYRFSGPFSFANAVSALALLPEPN